MLTPRQLEIMQHALGLNRYGQGLESRNHFCAGAEDEPICRELAVLGYMESFARRWLPDYNCIVTPAGKAAVQEQSLAPPKLTRSQHRYRAFLRADTGRSFGEWLKDQALHERGDGCPRMA